jgi:DNA invertase Pin-like site-specific DNA recombinase
VLLADNGDVMTRAIIWLRVSTGAQDEASQLPDCIAWCEARGYEYEVHRVRGASAYHGEQDADWQAVIGKIRAGQASVIVIWKVDRLDRRNILHAVPMVNLAIRQGAVIEFATQPYIDLTTMPGRMAFGNMCEMAHEESRTKSDRVKAKHRNLRSHGSWVGRAPLGYEIVTAGGAKTLRLSRAARLVSDIFGHYASGLSLADIGQRYQMHSRVVWQILTNETYKGRAVHGGDVLTVPEIVSPELWARVRDRLASSPVGRRGAVDRSRQALLTSVLSCGECGRPMYRNGDRYRCQGGSRKLGGCGAWLNVAAADAEALALVSSATDPHVTWETVPDTRQDDIERLSDQVADASKRRDWAAVAELGARIDALESQPSAGPRVIEHEHGSTWGQYFRGLDTGAQRAELRKSVTMRGYLHDGKPLLEINFKVGDE